MILPYIILLAINISCIHCFLTSPILSSPKIASHFDLSIRGLEALPSDFNNAFDLIDSDLRENLSTEFGILEPNEVQNVSIPIAIGGKDVSVIAQTGSGKTMSFLLPILHKCKNTLASNGPVAIVIGPTTELLEQHSSVASILFPSLDDQIIFRTPQELLDPDSAEIDLASIAIVAIDEVDAVLCGSEFNATTPKSSIELLSRFSENVQFILTTAHLTRAHTKVMNDLFPDIETIRQSSSSQRVLVPTLRQVFHYFCGDMTSKLTELQNVLENSEKQPTIVFCKDENEVEEVHTFLKNSKTLGDIFFPEKLHINLSPHERSTALQRFRIDEDECVMLVTHEIAARGLDCPSVRHVILFDTPTDVTAFVHRAGRTARAGEEGLVTCLVQGGGGLGSFGESGGSFGKHKNLHALLDAPKLSFTKANDTEPDEKIE